MARIAYLTGMLPASQRNGTEIATAMIADAISSLGHELVLVGMLRAGDAPSKDAIIVDEIAIETSRARRSTKLRWAIESVLRNEPLSVSKFRSPHGRRIYDALKGVDLVLVDKPQMAALYADQIGAVPMSVVWHAIEWKTYSDVATSSVGAQKLIYKREAALARSMERGVAARAAHVFALSDEDAAQIRDAGFNGRMTVMPLVMPCQNAISHGEAGTWADRHIALLGNWLWSANADGLNWFMDVVAPHLPSETRVVIAGSGSQIVNGRYDNIVGIGTVDDGPAFLDQAAGVAIPLISGTGVSMKVIEACNNGWPTVTTPVGSRGLALPLPSSLSIAETPMAFAEALTLVAKLGEKDRGKMRLEGKAWSASRSNTFREAVRSGIEAVLGPAN